MASPMLDGRSPQVLDPRKKAHFSLHISDRITKNDASLGSYASVKYNHKPAQTSQTRNTTLTPTSPGRYTLQLEDRDGPKNSDIFVFTGQRTEPKKSYILLFDPASQKATLEPLSSTYTFNLQSKNRKNVAGEHPKIYPKRAKDESQPADPDELFDEPGPNDNANDEPDPNNPYDFRHFLDRSKEKRGDESEYNNPSSPDERTGTGSAMDTPQMPARKSAASSASAAPKAKPQPAAARERKRKSPDVDPLMQKKKAPAKKQQQPAPAVRVERRASTYPKPDASAPAKPRGKAAQKAASASSKIKSAEIVHDSDESDMDAEGEATSSPPQMQQSPEPEAEPRRHDREEDVDDDREEEDADVGDGGGLEIEVPDARPKPRHSALAQLGLGQNLGLGGLGYLKSPSNGPISLASAANSVEGSPDPRVLTPQKKSAAREDDGVIDFGNIGGLRGDDSEEEDGGYAEDEDEEVEDRDVEPMDIGPPAQQTTSRKVSIGGAAMDEDEDDPLYSAMMEGLAGGDSSEESEEE